MNIILAPHLDDEIIGCYSVLFENVITSMQKAKVVYFQKDYRSDNIPMIPNVEYLQWDGGLRSDESDTIYIPSKFDYHPLHKKVNRIGRTLHGKKLFYSVEMNVPWLEEETNWRAKKELFNKLYPKEDMKNDKYWLFKSIKPYDDLIWATVKTEFVQYHKYPAAPDEVAYLRNLHRHKFYLTVQVQQVHDNRDVEYFILRDIIINIHAKIRWHENMSCEMYCQEMLNKVQNIFPDRMIRVSLFEDNENGCIIE